MSDECIHRHDCSIIATRGTCDAEGCERFSPKLHGNNDKPQNVTRSRMKDLVTIFEEVTLEEADEFGAYLYR